jgi:hypothetical protein
MLKSSKFWWPAGIGILMELIFLFTLGMSDGVWRHLTTSQVLFVWPLLNLALGPFFVQRVVALGLMVSGDLGLAIGSFEAFAEFPLFGALIGSANYRSDVRTRVIRLAELHVFLCILAGIVYVSRFGFQ